MNPGSLNGSDPLARRLHELVERSPDLHDAAHFYEIILPLVRDANLNTTPVSLGPEEARAKLAAGLPLLQDVALEVDLAAFHGLLLRLVCALENPGGSGRDRYSRIREALEADRVETGTLLSSIAGGDQGPVAAAAHSLQLDADLVRTLVRNALKPALHAWRRQLSPLLSGIPWDRGTCPICGAVAILGELQDNHLAKHLRCGQCGADWPFRRLRCTYCGNEDHQSLGYLYGEQRHAERRVEVCDKCKGYLKVIVSFHPTPPDILPIEDLATLHLDYIALERGYDRVAIEPASP
jgi:formate dehydrogenase accessory protein FdhE